MTDWLPFVGTAVAVTGLFAGFTKWILTSLKTSRSEQAESIMAQVKTMIDSQTKQTELITGALAQRLSSVDQHLDRQDQTQIEHGKDIAKIQGMLTQPSIPAERQS